ncbi:putative RNA helicase [Tieghemostelium lacteum]|uniref:Putative RNA helicase n=1 Tax=Tieghemostelium lacteum TaxID=361077 RepID=A0A152A5F5_TIELA|nr:putative RNA helicase [Tieghemostelium lacteum]|eukprot:KYR01458.1 putative RNA helicase [Tieghemostelium lacteum]
MNCSITIGDRNHCVKIPLYILQKIISYNIIYYEGKIEYIRRYIIQISQVCKEWKEKIISKLRLPILNIFSLDVNEKAESLTRMQLDYACKFPLRLYYYVPELNEISENVVALILHDDLDIQSLTTMPVFPNLSHISVIVNNDNQLQLMNQFIDLFPNLSAITILFENEMKNQVPSTSTSTSTSTSAISVKNEVKEYNRELLCQLFDNLQYVSKIYIQSTDYYPDEEYTHRLCNISVFKLSVDQLSVSPLVLSRQILYWNLYHLKLEIPSYTDKDIETLLEHLYKAPLKKFHLSVNLIRYSSIVFFINHNESLLKFKLTTNLITYQQQELTDLRITNRNLVKFILSNKALHISGESSDDEEEEEGGVEDINNNVEENDEQLPQQQQEEEYQPQQQEEGNEQQVLENHSEMLDEEEEDDEEDEEDDEGHICIFKQWNRESSLKMIFLDSIQVNDIDALLTYHKSLQKLVIECDFTVENIIPLVKGLVNLNVLSLKGVATNQQQQNDNDEEDGNVDFNWFLLFENIKLSKSLWDLKLENLDIPLIAINEFLSTQTTVTHLYLSEIHKKYDPIQLLHSIVICQSLVSLTLINTLTPSDQLSYDTYSFLLHLLYNFDSNLEYLKISNIIYIETYDIFLEALSLRPQLKVDIVVPSSFKTKFQKDLLKRLVFSK